jgi:AraC family transcriptional regulator of arabinose operon
MKSGKKIKKTIGKLNSKVEQSLAYNSNSDVYACLRKTGLSDPLRIRRFLDAGGIDSWTLEYTVAGCEYVRSPDGRTFHVEPGGVLLTKPKVPRDHGQESDCKIWERFWFAFEPHPHWEAMLFDWPELFPGTMHLILPDELRPDIEARMYKAMDIYYGAWNYRNEMVMNIIEEVLLWCDTVNPKTHFAGMDERIRRSLHFMSRHFKETLQVEDVARHAGLSRTRFSVFFHEQTGRTPREFIESCRIDEATNLLKLKHQTVSDVANACGFNDPARFSRVFKARTGKSPSELQKGK